MKSWHVSCGAACKSAFQPDRSDPQLLDWTSGKPWWRGTIPGTSAWPTFRAAIRAAPLAESSFHPFFHEVVSVQVSDDADEPPSVVGEFWPGAVVGSMLVARAGVAVRAGAHHLDADVAARSALYWAWWRCNRRAVDLSHGWDRNSPVEYGFSSRLHRRGPPALQRRRRSVKTAGPGSERRGPDRPTQVPVQNPNRFWRRSMAVRRHVCRAGTVEPLEARAHAAWPARRGGSVKPVEEQVTEPTRLMVGDILAFFFGKKI